MKVLDLYSGAGGAAMGYYRAGYEVTGVDRTPMPRFPFKFIQCDALEYLAYHGHEYDLIHASPPCQRSSRMTNCRPGLADVYPNFILPTRIILDWLGKPYVIENVVGSDVRPDIVLCGQMFGLDLYRHRLFESNVPLVAPAHPKHIVPASKAGHWKPGTIISVSGHVAPVSVAKQAMGIDWMNRDELGEAIPPAYTEYIGRQLRMELAA